ncbi:MAG: type VII secretion target [Actinophytocola sp.]|uniref:type VII secretion target n=1 Tax=Actinophytocola sp. TaxID=1872138 RepID=UPI003C76FDC2
MTDSIDLTPAELRKQAADLREFAEDLKEANTSAAGRDLYAYGVIGLAWSSAMDERFAAADQFTGDAAHAAERVAAQLDAMATDYETKEHDSAASMQQISGDLS